MMDWQEKIITPQMIKAALEIQWHKGGLISPTRKRIAWMITSKSATQWTLRAKIQRGRIVHTGWEFPYAHG